MLFGLSFLFVLNDGKAVGCEIPKKKKKRRYSANAYNGLRLTSTEIFVAVVLSDNCARIHGTFGYGGQTSYVGKTCNAMISYLNTNTCTVKSYVHIGTGANLEKFLVSKQEPTKSLNWLHT